MANLHSLRDPSVETVSIRKERDVHLGQDEIKPVQTAGLVTSFLPPSWNLFAHALFRNARRSPHGWIDRKSRARPPFVSSSQRENRSSCSRLEFSYARASGR